MGKMGGMGRMGEMGAGRRKPDARRQTCHCEEHAERATKQPCSPKEISCLMPARAASARMCLELRREITVGLQGCFASLWDARNDTL